MSASVSGRDGWEGWGVSTACPDWHEKLEAGQIPISDAVLDAYAYTDEAERAVRVFSRLRLGDVVGNPTTIEAGCDWFLPIVRVLFGSLDPRTDERAIREIMCLTPKKCGKTTFAALLILVDLLICKTPRQSWLLIAPTVDSAKLAFNQMKAAVELDPALSAVLDVSGGLGTSPMRIRNRRTGGLVTIRPFDARSLTGVRQNTMCDELHLLSELSGADRAFGQARGALMSDSRSFSFWITTQSERPPKGIFRQQLDRGRATRSGENDDPSFLFVAYEPDATDKPDDPETWKLVIPPSAPIKISDMQRAYSSAVAAGESEKHRWLSQHVNVEIGTSVQEEGWPVARYWDRLTDPDLRPTFESMRTALDRCTHCTIGIDVGGSDDMSSVCMLFMDENDRDDVWRVTSRAWLTTDGLALRPQFGGDWSDLMDEGTLSRLEHVGDDIDAVLELVRTVHEAGKLAGIGIDPYGAADLVRALQIYLGETDDTPEGERYIHGIAQNFTLTAPILSMERKAGAGKLRHDGSKLLRMAIGNAVLVPRGISGVGFERRAARKIDPLMAMTNAAACALIPRPEPLDVSCMIG